MHERRNILALMGGVAALGAAALPTAAVAQSEPATEAGSTWDQIMKRGNVRLGVINSEPWYLKDLQAPQGSLDAWKGIGPYLGKQIAAAMNVKLELVETTWGGAVAALQANQFDFIFMLDGTPQRAMAVDFVPAPILWYPTSALVRDGIAAETWDALDNADYMIGVTLGSTTEVFASAFFKKAKVVKYSKTDETVASFASGRSDLIILVAPGTDAFAFKLKKGKSIVPKPYQWFAGGTALRLEESRRWKDFLTTSVIYFYNGGVSQKAYEEFLAFRGMDVNVAHPVMRELYKS